MTHSPITFHAAGIPRPKQSFRYAKHGSYQTARVKAWQDIVARAAWDAMNGREKLSGPVAVRLQFTLPDRTRRDLDNLCKGTIDAMLGIVFDDDHQIVDLHATKNYTGQPGVSVEVRNFK